MKKRSRRRAGERGYPRPQLQREEWTSLDGQWDFAIDADARWTAPEQVRWGKKIRVPFSPETPASGIENAGFYKACWYRRTFEAPRLARGQRLILHFSAVDYIATVYVNGAMAVQHEGAYTPFSADITDHLARGKSQTIIVRAEDDPQDLAKPRGKQDWHLEPHSIWYPRTTGIWQSVWVERVATARILSIKWIPHPEQWQIEMQAKIEDGGESLRLHLTLQHEEDVLAVDEFAVLEPEVHRQIILKDPGIDDARNELMWHPDRPKLINAEVDLIDEYGKVVDSVRSYTAIRQARVHGPHFILNGKPYKLRLVLDQGYWPESGLTAPDDDALRKDVELVKAMGFNGVRKHQKIEDPRFLYWADRLGLLVWEEMPSPYSFTDATVGRVTRQWIEAIDRDISHPCIVAWVPINESWGVPDLPHRRDQRDFLQALYHLTKSLDPSRPVISNDGWEAADTDIIGIHDYSRDPKEIKRRYKRSDQGMDELFEYERPGNKQLLLDDFPYRGQPIMLTEFGGIAYSKGEGWGYMKVNSPEELALRYYDLTRTVRSRRLFAGFCYTQFTDTYQEVNGLLYMDRTPKFPIEQIAVATRGAVNEDERRIENQWRRQLKESRGSA